MRQTLIACAFLTLVAAGCSDNANSEVNGKSPGAPLALPTQTIEADLATGATSVASLSKTASVVVLAKAGESRQTTNEADPTIPVTHQQFEIVKPFTSGAPDTITVEFTGGVDASKDQMLELEGQPPFQPGAEYFLALIGPTSDGEYWAVGGPQGRYLVADGHLVPEVGASKSDPVIAALEGLSPEEAGQLLTE